MAAPKTSVEQNQLGREELYLKMRLVCTTVADAGIQFFCVNSSDVEGYSDEDAQTIATKLGFTTTNLDDDAAAAIVGVHINVSDAAEVIEIRLCKDAIAASQVLVSGSTPGDLTAVTPILYGASNTGITSTSGIAFTLTLTGVDSDSAVGTIDFWIHVVYAKSQPRF